MNDKLFKKIFIFHLNSQTVVIIIYSHNILMLILIRKLNIFKNFLI